MSWTGQVLCADGSTLNLSLMCNGMFILNGQLATSTQCSPLSLSFPALDNMCSCGGSGTFTVTE